MLHSVWFVFVVLLKVIAFQIGTWNSKVVDSGELSKTLCKHQWWVGLSGTQKSTFSWHPKERVKQKFIFLNNFKWRRHLWTAPNPKTQILTILPISSKYDVYDADMAGAVKKRDRWTILILSNTYTIVYRMPLSYIWVNKIFW